MKILSSRTIRAAFKSNQEGKKRGNSPLTANDLLFYMRKKESELFNSLSKKT